MTLIRIGAARPCRFDRCRFPQRCHRRDLCVHTALSRPTSEAADRFQPDAGRVSLFFMARLQSRLPASLYVAGPFAMGYTEFYNFLIPLYGLSLGMSAGQIGMLVGARSLLAVFLSIHVGAYGPVGHSPGCLVLCLDGDDLGAGLPAAAVVLALTAAADRQWRRAAVCLVGFANLDRPIG